MTVAVTATGAAAVSKADVFVPLAGLDQTV